MGALLVAAAVAGCDAATKGDAPSDPAALPTDRPLIERYSALALAGLPNTLTEVWGDGRYTITFENVPVATVAGIIEGPLEEATITGMLAADTMRDFVELLAAADLRSFASELAEVECPVVIDGASSRYRLTNGGASVETRPCEAWSLDEYPPLLRAAAELTIAAEQDRPEDYWRHLRYASSLDQIGSADWSEQALVSGVVTAADADGGTLSFDLATIVAGETGATAYVLAPGSIDDDVQPDELALLSSATAGDRVVALVRGSAAELVGFLDDAGGIEVTSISHSALSLGHAAVVATRMPPGPAPPSCPGVEHALALDAEFSAPLDALVRIARDADTARRRTAFIKTGRDLTVDHEKPANFRPLTEGEVIVVTDGDGSYLGHLRAKDRHRDHTTIRILGDLHPIVVWRVPAEALEGCNRHEFGLVARAAGSLAAEIPADRVATDPAFGLDVNLETGRFGFGP